MICNASNLQQIDIIKSLNKNAPLDLIKSLLYNNQLRIAVMSSIISDIFYGSKQNLLDNYLANRAQPNYSQSKSNKIVEADIDHIELIFESMQASKNNSLYKIRVEMGLKNDQNFLLFENGNLFACLSINQINGEDLMKYTNIKIIVSSGQSKAKNATFIPIETIQSILKDGKTQKELVIELKGKGKFQFSRLKCTIKIQVRQANRILNSQILKSDNDISNFTKENPDKEIYQFQNSSNSDFMPHSRSRRLQKGNQKNRYWNIHEKSNSIEKQSISSNSFYHKQKELQSKKQNPQPKQAKLQQFVKQIKNIKFVVTKIIFFKQKQSQIIIQLSTGQIIKVNQDIEISHVGRKGVEIKLLKQGKQIGIVHLSSLVLFIVEIKGDFPIYDVETDQCIGTISISQFKQPIKIIQAIQSPKQKPLQILTNNVQFDKSILSSRQQQIKTRELTVIQINKIVFLKFELEEINNSLLLKRQIENSHQIYQIIVRINQQVYNFSNIIVKFHSNLQNYKLFSLERKEKIIVKHFEYKISEQIKVEIQIFKDYRLVSYTKFALPNISQFKNIFQKGQTSNNQLCVIHLKMSNILAKQNDFQVSKIGKIYDILEKILNLEINYDHSTQNFIKTVMNNSKDMTYVQSLHLSRLIIDASTSLLQYSNYSLRNIYQDNDILFQKGRRFLSQKLLQQFLYLDQNHSQTLEFEKFDEIIKFYDAKLRDTFQINYQDYIKDLICWQNKQKIFETKKERKVLYLFFIAGYYFCLISKQKQLIPIESDKEKINNQVEYKSKQSNNFRNQNTERQVKGYIQKIQLFNIQILNKERIPNLKLSIWHKICYSNANPQFVIQKQVNLSTPLIIYHKNIGEDKLVELAQVQLERKRSRYELDLNGKSYLKIHWGH